MGEAAENYEDNDQGMDVLTTDHISELEDLCTLKIAAEDKLNQAINEVAEKYKFDKTVLRQFITARVRDKEEEFHKRQDQMSFLFDTFSE